jgi:hypothetical protein
MRLRTVECKVLGPGRVQGGNGPAVESGGKSEGTATVAVPSPQSNALTVKPTGLALCFKLRPFSWVHPSWLLD